METSPRATSENPIFRVGLKDEAGFGLSPLAWRKNRREFMSARFSFAFQFFHRFDLHSSR